MQKQHGKAIGVAGFLDVQLLALMLQDMRGVRLEIGVKAGHGGFWLERAG